MLVFNNFLQDSNNCTGHVKFTSMDDFFIKGNDNKEMYITIDDEPKSIQNSYVDVINKRMSSIKYCIDNFIVNQENSSQNYLFFIIK